MPISLSTQNTCKNFLRLQNGCYDLGCNVICWCWSIVFFENQRHCTHLPRKFWSTSCFLLLTSFLKMLISFSSRIWLLPHCQKYQKLVKWPWCWCAWLASKLTRPEHHREYMGIVKRKMRNKRPKNADELKATIKETWASIPPQQCHKLITSMPRRIEAVIKAKGAPAKYWVHIQYMKILSRRPTIH